MQAYSQDLRERVLRAIERGEGPTDIARRYECAANGEDNDKSTKQKCIQPHQSLTERPPPAGREVQPKRGVVSTPAL